MLLKQPLCEEVHLFSNQYKLQEESRCAVYSSHGTSGTSAFNVWVFLLLLWVFGFYLFSDLVFDNMLTVNI